MRVRARMQRLEPDVMQPPRVCPYEGCQGEYFKMHDHRCAKPLRDTKLDQVVAYRRKCLACGRTHRVYPEGVSKAQQSGRLKSLSVLLYVLGISYRGIEDVLSALGCYLDHTTIYRIIQAAGGQVQDLRRGWLEQEATKVSVVGVDLTYLRCRGERVALAVAIDAQTGVTLDVEILDNEETETIKAWLGPLLNLVNAKVLASDDQDVFKAVADSEDVSHQICRQHVTRNVLDFVAKTAERVMSAPPPVPEGLYVTPEQLLEDLALLEWIMLGHPENGPQLLAELYAHYSQAPAPRRGKRATIWYRMRNHVLRLWNHWHRHTCYRTSLTDLAIPVEETNNATERVIGWNIKERYRTMRGYKREDSITNVAMLTAWLREEPAGRDLSELFVS